MTESWDDHLSAIAAKCWESIADLNEYDQQTVIGWMLAMRGLQGGRLDVAKLTNDILEMRDTIEALRKAVSHHQGLN